MIDMNDPSMKQALRLTEEAVQEQTRLYSSDSEALRLLRRRFGELRGFMERANCYLVKHYQELHEDRETITAALSRERLANMRADQAEEAREAAQSATGWIACSDRLPRDNTSVIVEGGIGYIRKGVWMTITAFDWPGKPIQWEVTHWMPLPAAPVASTSEGKDGA